MSDKFSNIQVLTDTFFEHMYHSCSFLLNWLIGMYQARFPREQYRASRRSKSQPTLQLHTIVVVAVGDGPLPAALPTPRLLAAHMRHASSRCQFRAFSRSGVTVTCDL